MRCRVCVIVLASLLFAVIPACGIGAPPGTGPAVNTVHPRSTLVLLYLADSPADEADALEISFRRISLYRELGAANLSEDVQTHEVLSLRNGKRVKLAQKEVGQGEYLGIRLVFGVAGMLVLAACIEAFWSPREVVPPAVRMGVGVLIWVATLAYFIFVGRRNGS